MRPPLRAHCRPAAAAAAGPSSRPARPAHPAPGRRSGPAAARAGEDGADGAGGGEGEGFAALERDWAALKERDRALLAKEAALQEALARLPEDAAAAAAAAAEGSRRADDDDEREALYATDSPEYFEGMFTSPFRESDAERDMVTPTVKFIARSAAVLALLTLGFLQANGLFGGPERLEPPPAPPEAVVPSAGTEAAEAGPEPSPGPAERPAGAGEEAAEVGAEKPNPVIFEKAVLPQGVEPAPAVHIGDDRRNDLFGARDAGGHALLMGADLTARDDALDEVRALSG